MPAFISKLQYKTCEDGEYYQEQARTLEETLALINTFPWERERFAEIDLIGPSVTITDGNGNYLKVGIHYGGTFHLYYLDKRNRFYERYPIHIDDVEEMVTDFFNGRLKLQQFGKGSYGYFKRRYFITKSFNYTIKTWKTFLYTFWIWLIALVFGGFFILTLFSGSASFGAEVLLATFVALAAATPFYCFIKVRNYKGQHLHITRANAEFTFGHSLNEAKTYNKADVAKIITTASVNSKEPIEIKLIEIIFNDGSSIRFPNTLISTGVLSGKFPSYFKPEYIAVRKWILAEL
jgi:hypothetical protein